MSDVPDDFGELAARCLDTDFLGIRRPLLCNGIG